MQNRILIYLCISWLSVWFSRQVCAGQLASLLTVWETTSCIWFKGQTSPPTTPFRAPNGPLHPALSPLEQTYTLVASELILKFRDLGLNSRSSGSMSAKLVVDFRKQQNGGRDPPPVSIKETGVERVRSTPASPERRCHHGEAPGGRRPVRQILSSGKSLLLGSSARLANDAPQSHHLRTNVLVFYY